MTKYIQIIKEKSEIIEISNEVMNE